MDYQDKLNEHLQAIVGKQLDALTMACEMMMFSFEKYARHAMVDARYLQE